MLPAMPVSGDSIHWEARMVGDWLNPVEVSVLSMSHTGGSSWKD